MVCGLVFGLVFGLIFFFGGWFALSSLLYSGLVWFGLVWFIFVLVWLSLLWFGFWFWFGFTLLRFHLVDLVRAGWFYFGLIGLLGLVTFALLPS